MVHYLTMIWAIVNRTQSAMDSILYFCKSPGRHGHTNFVIIKYCICMMDLCSNVPNQEPLKSRDFNYLIRRKYMHLFTIEISWINRKTREKIKFWNFQWLIFPFNQIIKVSAFEGLLIRYIRAQSHHSNAIFYDDKVSVAVPTCQVISLSL